MRLENSVLFNQRYIFILLTFSVYASWLVVANFSGLSKHFSKSNSIVQTQTMQQAIATPQANFAILRDTPSLLIVHKPPNVPFHNDDLSAGAVTLLREQLGASYPRIYPTHR